MDVEDDSVTYLKFLNDGIGDSFFIEPIFTEIETIDWQAESLPILLHNSSNGKLVIIFLQKPVATMFLFKILTLVWMYRNTMEKPIKNWRRIQQTTFMWLEMIFIYMSMKVMWKIKS